MTRRYITCPICGFTSFSPGDVQHRFCAHCGRFHDDMTTTEIKEATYQHYCVERFTRTPLGRFVKWWSGQELRR